KSNGATVQSVGGAFRRAMEKEHRNQFYRGNVLYIAAGFFVSVLLLLLIFAFGGFEPEMLAAAFGIIFPSAVVAFIAGNVGRQFRQARSLGARIWAVIATAFVGFIGL